MTNLAFAKQVPGGFKIVSLDSLPYTVTELPKDCPATGHPVIVSPDTYDFLASIGEQVTNHLERLGKDFRSIIVKFLDEHINSLDNYQRNPTDWNSKVIALGYSGAVASIFRRIVNECVKQIRRGDIIGERALQTIKKEICTLAANDGWHIPNDNQQLEIPIEDFETFLSQIFDGVRNNGNVIRIEDGSQFREVASVPRLEKELIVN